MIIKTIDVRYRCDKCQWEWIPRKEGLSRCCPNCATTKWNSSESEIDLTVPIKETLLDVNDVEPIRKFESQFGIDINQLFRHYK